MDNNDKNKINKPAQPLGKMVKKKGLDKFLSNFFLGSGADVKNYVIDDVAFPSIKKLVYDICTGVLGILLFNDKATTSKPGGIRSGGMSYADIYGNKNKTMMQKAIVHDSFAYSFATHEEAARIYNELADSLYTYKIVRVSEFYEMVGETCDYTYQNYGWTNLDEMRIAPNGPEWYLYMPKAYPIKK